MLYISLALSREGGTRDPPPPKSSRRSLGVRQVLQCSKGFAGNQSYSSAFATCSLSASGLLSSSWTHLGAGRWKPRLPNDSSAPRNLGGGMIGVDLRLRKSQKVGVACLSGLYSS
jgi:hypothetical protein